MNNKVKYLLLGLLSALVVKGVVSSLNVAEALVAISIIGFNAYLVYLDKRKVEEVTEDFNKRLFELETRSAFVGIRRNS